MQERQTDRDDDAAGAVKDLEAIFAKSEDESSPWKFVKAWFETLSEPIAAAPDLRDCRHRCANVAALASRGGLVTGD